MSEQHRHEPAKAHVPAHETAKAHETAEAHDAEKLKESKAAKATKANVARMGTVHGCEPGKLTLAKGKDADREGECCPVAEKCVVVVNGVESPVGLDDLRRGDLLTCEGDPITKIEVTRE